MNEGEPTSEGSPKEQTSNTPKEGEGRNKGISETPGKEERVSLENLSPEEKIDLFLERIEDLNSKLLTMAERTEGLAAAFDELENMIKNGVIKSFAQLEEVVGKLSQVISQSSEKIEQDFRVISQVLGTAGEESEAVRRLQEQQAKMIKNEFLPELHSFYGRIEGLAKTAIREGIGPEGPMGRGVDLLREVEELPKDSSEVTGWLARNGEKIKSRLSAAISAIEEQDKAFGESWRDTWPTETLLARLYTHSVEINSPQLREFQRELRQEYEDRRRIHDYFWMYQRTSGLDAVLQMSAVLPKSAVERMVRKGAAKEGGRSVAEAMVEMQEMLKEWEKAKKGGEEDTQKEISRKIVAFGRGYKLEEVEEGGVKKLKEVEDTENGENNRIAARLMVILGLTSQYGYTDFGGSGDFLIGRLLNLRDHIMPFVEPGKRWQYRDKIMAGFQQHLYFSGPLAGGGLGKSEKVKAVLEDMGLEMVDDPIFEDGKEVDHRILIKIKDASLLGKKFAVDGPEGFFGGAKWADNAFRADAGRKAFRNTGCFLDNPTEKNFYELLVKDFEHLSGKERWEFFSHLVGGIIEFYKDEGGVIRRALKGKLITTFEYEDEKGRKRSFRTFANSDAMRAGVSLMGWNSLDIDGFISGIQQSAPDTLGPLGEWLKREKIRFLGLPGIGPVRGVKELFDTVKESWLLALLAMLAEIFKASLPEELELGGKKR